jgi:hypothetical protein
MGTENKESLFKVTEKIEPPLRVKIAINEHLEKIGKPKKFYIPAKNNEE